VNESCPVPGQTPADERDVISRLIQAKRIAVIGVSPDPSKPSHYVTEYMQSVGREILPVNPTIDKVLGLKVYASLSEIEGPIDLVNVFRLPKFCGEIAKQAAAVGARGLWLQSGIVSPDARETAKAAGMDYVENHCLMVEHRRASL
jgi:predicted CoA-binding protein